MEPESNRQEGPTVVGIGASAGGLAALKTFLSHVPEDSNLAFVVVVHLAPDHESHLAQLLQPEVPFPVQQVTGNVLLERNNVYVIPPNANLNAIDTHLRLSRLEDARRERAPIDHFFRTLAKAHDGRSIAVVLTGTGTDGTLGIKDVKAAGGFVIVQDPAEAEYDGMPQSAIATGMADFVLPIAAMPATILRFDTVEPRVPSIADGQSVPPDERALLQEILAHLRTVTDRDFSRYKPSTVLRRVARRMQLNHIEDLAKYTEMLRGRVDESRALADDLLITVTRFFRDTDVFEKLEKEIIPQLFHQKTPNDSVRVWSVGRATGEEAYSLAILLTEAADRLETPPQIQVFATDLHPRSLATAREGLYPEDIGADVSEERLKRFFEPEIGGWRICKEIRGLVVFAAHNILSDPPFSRMDLISCRNLLIYLERNVQRDVWEVFHYSLNPDGVMLLGTAESCDISELFRALDKKLCLFMKRNTPVREPRLPVFPQTRIRFPGDGAKPAVRGKPMEAGELHQRMVEQYAPPSILIGPDNKVLHISDNAGRYMVVPGGEPTSSVTKLVRPELQLELQASLHAAREKQHPFDSRPIAVRFNGDAKPVVMHVRPALEPAREGYVLVLFEERAPVEKGAGPEPESASAAHEARVEDLEAQVVAAHLRTQTVIEEYESNRDAMSASSEEMQSTNEELRSTLEELETSKEELQSINEELHTVNQQNRHKVAELAQLSADLQNLLTATDIATLFLDRHLRILRFTPKLGDLFSVRGSDRGRPIADLTHKLGYDELTEDAQSVLIRLIPVEREVQDETGRWYLTRVLPYRRTEDRIDGVVITFIDIDERKKAEARISAAADRLRRMVNVDVIGVLIFDDKGTLIDCNETFEKISGYSREEVTSRTLTWQVLTPDEYRAASEEQMLKLSETGRVGPYEKEYFRKDGSRLWMIFAGAALGDGTVIEYCVDISDRKRAEREVIEAKSFAESIINTLHEPLLVLTPELVVHSANPSFYKHFEVKPAETLGRKIFDLGNRQWHIPALRKLLEDVLPKEQQFDDFEVEHTFENIGARTMLVNARRLDHVNLILLGLRDITERKQVEKELQGVTRDLRTANEALLRANDDLRHFSYAVSHDMQEPLRMVTIYTQLLERDFGKNLDEHARQYIEYAVTGASRMEMLLNGLRDYWSATGRTIEKLDRVDFNAALGQALANLELPIAESGAVITHDALPTIPAEQNPITQVFQNLISNAIKYRHPDRKPKIHVSAERQDSTWVFSVKDNGTGIDPQFLDLVFVPFKRLNGGPAPGIGLGLAMCRRIVERYHGRIEAVPVEGEGSTFRFTIPDAGGEI